jgi:hypothetical protein
LPLGKNNITATSAAKISYMWGPIPNEADAIRSHSKN